MNTKTAYLLVGLCFGSLIVVMLFCKNGLNDSRIDGISTSIEDEEMPYDSRKDFRVDEISTSIEDEEMPFFIVMESSSSYTPRGVEANAYDSKEVIAKAAMKAVAAHPPQDIKLRSMKFFEDSRRSNKMVQIAGGFVICETVDGTLYRVQLDCSDSVNGCFTGEIAVGGWEKVRLPKSFEEECEIYERECLILSDLIGKRVEIKCPDCNAYGVYEPLADRRPRRLLFVSVQSNKMINGEREFYNEVYRCIVWRENGIWHVGELTLAKD